MALLAPKNVIGIFVSKKALLFLSAFLFFGLCSVQKPHTFMVFMERINELDSFGTLNIKQMKAVGSNKNINIVVYMHCEENNIKKTKVLFIKKNEAVLLKETPESNKAFNIKEELINFCNETIQKYPAKHYSLILWNHGTGAIEPCTRNIASDIFTFAFAKQQPRTQHTNYLLKNIEFGRQKPFKGVCFNDSNGSFLGEKQLQEALKSVCATSLNNNKFDIIGFDACLMSMVEVGASLKEHATFMVGSQEVELGTGWNYARVLAPFSQGTLSPQLLGQHIVQCYAQTYNATEDYTLSAIDLTMLSKLEKNIQDLGNILITIIKQQNNIDFLYALRASRNKHYCTHFDEPNFIDLQHFYLNLLENTSQIITQKKQDTELLEALRTNLLDGKTLISKIVFANKTGSKHKNASGLSIYFPEKYIHSSYHKAAFTLANPSWINFLQTYLLL